MDIGFQQVQRPRAEKNDCAVRALANATGMRYADAYFIFNERGRNALARTPHTIVESVYAEYGTRETLSCTLAEFIRAKPRGVFIAWMRGHVFAVRDGIVIDMGKLKPGTKILACWAIKEVKPLVVEPKHKPFDVSSLVAKINAQKRAAAASAQ